MEVFRKVDSGHGEQMIYSLLSELAPVYNPSFRILRLPEALGVDSTTGELLLPYYEGKGFNESWNEANGGSPLGLDLAAELPLLIQDFASIDLGLVERSDTPVEALSLTFDAETAHVRAREIVAELVAS